MSQLQNGDWYQAQDGYWYCWPNPTAYSAPPAPAAVSRPMNPGTIIAPTAPAASSSSPTWWKRKRVIIPVGVLAGLVAIGLAVPTEKPEEQVALTNAPAAVPAASPETTTTPLVEATTQPPAPVSTVVAPTKAAVVAAPAATRAPVTKAAEPAVEADAVAPAVNFVMPSYIGENLQDAQNDVQTQGIFYSRSHDLLGSRFQVIDSNWQVCSQTPAAGKRLRGAAGDFEGAIDFGVVKLTESCP